MSKVVAGLIGLGTVGTGVVKLLERQKHIRLKTIAVRNLQKEREVNPACLFTENVQDIIQDPEIELVIEVAGGIEPVYSYLEAALRAGKHVVTANKKLLARRGPELFSLARAKGVNIFFEASVAGGVPLISTLQKGLNANLIRSVAGILNGTTNYILSRMHSNGCSFAEALKEAQELGFAEADPTDDVEGHDVAHKLSILAALSFGRFANPEQIYREGITTITTKDIALAKAHGCVIKLIGLGLPQENNKVELRVHPVLVPFGHPFYAVNGAENAILVNGSAVGQILLSGPGAGREPTASAVVGDALNLAQVINLPEFESFFQPEITTDWASLSEESELGFANLLRIKLLRKGTDLDSVTTTLLQKGLKTETLSAESDEDGCTVLSLKTAVQTDAVVEEALAHIPDAIVTSRLRLLPERLTTSRTEAL
ncbi:MAG: homoserine dehydrogenase [Candidatus Obscuribacter sp.]|nr:homoserine dehydrogenase [Candidatus Obscuribacter sp.]